MFFFSGLKKWVEIGNSGVFRPEMLLPMGLPRNVNVIAWGLSTERYEHTKNLYCFFFNQEIENDSTLPVFLALCNLRKFRCVFRTLSKIPAIDM